MKKKESALERFSGLVSENGKKLIIDLLKKTVGSKKLREKKSVCYRMKGEAAPKSFCHIPVNCDHSDIIGEGLEINSEITSKVNPRNTPKISCRVRSLSNQSKKS
jgi:hypothetical protein